MCAPNTAIVQFIRYNGELLRIRPKEYYFEIPDKLLKENLKKGDLVRVQSMDGTGFAIVKRMEYIERTEEDEKLKKVLKRIESLESVPIRKPKKRKLGGSICQTTDS